MTRSKRESVAARGLARPSHIPAAKIEAVDVALGYVLKRGRQFFPVSEHLDLTVKEGSFISIVGKSGCGKSTFIHALQGLVRIAGGSLKVDGTEVVGPRPGHAVVFQDASLFPWRTVWKNIIYGLEVQRRATPAALDYSRQLIDIVGLQGFAGSRPYQLSGGMKQRVNLARALALDPTLLLLDEPFAALDAQTREAMQLEMARIWQITEEMSAEPKTAVFITHDIAEAVFVADRVVVMSDRPSRITNIIDVDLPRPRGGELKRDPEFNAYVQQITDLLNHSSTVTDQGGGNDE